MGFRKKGVCDLRALEVQGLEILMIFRVWGSTRGAQELPEASGSQTIWEFPIGVPHSRVFVFLGLTIPASGSTLDGFYSLTYCERGETAELGPPKP